MHAWPMGVCRVKCRGSLLLVYRAGASDENGDVAYLHLTGSLGDQVGSTFPRAR